MIDLFDQPTLHRGSTDTSQAAADAMDAGGVGSLRRAVYDAIRYAGTLGLTTREASDVVCWKYEGVQPRTSELRDNGYIRDSGLRRKAEGRRVAETVWVVAKPL